MEKFCHKIWKIIFVSQSVCKAIHQGPGTGWLPRNRKNLGIGTFKGNWKDCKNFQPDQRPHLQSDSSENQATLHGAENMHKISITGTICVYNWTNMMVDMGIDNFVSHDRELHHARILNYILRTRYKENQKHLHQKYKNIGFLDDEYNQTYMISPGNQEFKGPTRRNNQYCAVGKPLNWRYGDNAELRI